MNTLDLHRKSSILWNGTYTIYYRFAYSIYLFLLYTLVEPKIFGTIGTLFSLIYLSKNFFELGLIQSYSPFFLTFTKSRNAFKEFFYAQMIAHAVLFMVAIPIVSLYYAYIINAKLIPCEPLTWGLLFLIFVCEVISNSLRKILKLALFYKSTAIIEMLAISVFLGLILIGIVAKCAIAINFVFFCFLAHSLFSIITLSYGVAQWYQGLPKNAYSIKKINLKDLIIVRFFSFMTILGNTVFSSNFLVPLIAAQQGLEVIAFYKLVSNCAHNIDLFLEHTFGQTGESILSNIEHSMTTYRQEVFKLLSKNIFHIVFALFVFLTINHTKFFSLIMPSINSELSLSLFLYFFILLNNSLFSTYKSLYATQHYFAFYALIKLFMFASTFTLIFYKYSLSLVTILGTMLALQISALMIIAAGAYYLWNITFPFGINHFHLVSYTALSLAFFFLL